jgi:hypothetical protein
MPPAVCTKSGSNTQKKSKLVHADHAVRRLLEASVAEKANPTEQCRLAVSRRTYDERSFALLIQSSTEKRTSWLSLVSASEEIVTRLEPGSSSSSVARSKASGLGRCEVQPDSPGSEYRDRPVQRCFDKRLVDAFYIVQPFGARGVSKLDTHIRARRT